jgi:2-oxoglutarate dehydrogenase E1 component
VEPQQPTSLASRPSVFAAANSEYLEALYQQFRQDPALVPAEWQAFFQGFEMAMCPRSCQASAFAHKQGQVTALIEAYRSLGHLVADTDPLGEPKPPHPDLALPAFGLTDADLDGVFDAGDLADVTRAPLRQIVAALEATYCRSVAVEYQHLQERAMRRWLQQQMEPLRNRPALSREQKLVILRHLTDAEQFETFVARHYPGQKRFSLEGAEALIPLLHEIVEQAPELGVEEIVLGMAHRGRLNVLANLLDKSYGLIFSEFDDTAWEQPGGDGDVKYHRGYSSEHANRWGRSCHLTLTSNPSHLEAVDPVVEGRVRAKQRQRGDTVGRRKVVPLLVHGDAAFAGQGIVAETFNLAGLPGYRTGGTVHVVVNNQIGFTTSPTDSRSTRYCTDVAKGFDVPVFHVNGDDPEAVVHVAALALRFRQQFGRDVVIDLVCYRRHGHNEGDEPRFTQPLLYEKIRNRPTVRRLYEQRLVDEGVLIEAALQRLADDLEQRLVDAFNAVRQGGARYEVPAYGELWRGLDNAFSFAPVDTGAPHPTLVAVTEGLTRIPPGFELNPKVAKRLPDVLAAVREGGPVDWPTAELLAFGTLLTEGVKVRLSGQDCGRGTFSQRHAVWRDMRSQSSWIPLQNLSPDQARFMVYDSSLSEASVLGFEYGYSLAEPRALILWEAQFGDFANGAQVILDQFVFAAEAKWQRSSGLVLLLPHGYEGQGPEHSNAYVERYLQACADDNVQVVVPTTPAQYFHVLRRQVKRTFRNPLVVFTPKSLLRLPACTSAAGELSDGGFREVLGDPLRPSRARRVVLVTGKLFYELEAARRAKNVSDVAIVRVEQLHPLHEDALREAVEAHPANAEIVWAQEEPRNRGAWTFLEPRLRELFPKRKLRYEGRPASASPATGSAHVHREAQAALIARALGI